MIRNLSFILLLGLLPFWGYNQVNDVEALKKAYSKSSGEKKLEKALALLDHYRKENPKTAAKYAESALKLSRKENNLQGTITSAYFLGIHYRDIEKFDRAEKRTVEGIGAATKLQDKEARKEGQKILVTIYQLSHNTEKQVAANLNYENLKADEEIEDLGKVIGEQRVNIEQQEKFLQATQAENEEFKLQNNQLQTDLVISKEKLWQEEAKLANMKMIKAQVESEKAKQALELLATQTQLESQRRFNRLVVAGLIITLLFAGIIYQNFRLIRLRSEERERSRKQLIMQEKMATLGQLTAGIAHEIKNPLNFVNNFSEGSIDLVEELEENLESIETKADPTSINECQELADELKENAGAILSHGQRIEKIVHSMMEHARGNSGERQLIDLNGLIDENLTLATAGYKGQHHDFDPVIKSDLDLSIGKVSVVTQDVSRVLLNIFGNAFYALHQRRKEEGSVFVPTLAVNSINDGRFAYIEIQDNGPGIPQNVIEKIFTPFFTTKPTGEGNTGLGLSISYDIIVQGHQGELNVESSEGEFTKFSIKLPI